MTESSVELRVKPNVGDSWFVNKWKASGYFHPLDGITQEIEELWSGGQVLVIDEIGMIITITAITSDDNITFGFYEIKSSDGNLLSHARSAQGAARNVLRALGIKP